MMYPNAHEGLQIIPEWLARAEWTSVVSACGAYSYIQCHCLWLGSIFQMLLDILQLATVKVFGEGDVMALVY